MKQNIIFVFFKYVEKVLQSQKVSTKLINSAEINRKLIRFVKFFTARFPKNQEFQKLS